jgi:hypothetical protein
MRHLQKAKLAEFKYTILNKIAQHILFISCALLRIPKMESKGKTVLMNHHIDNKRRRSLHLKSMHGPTGLMGVQIFLYKAHSGGVLMP